MSVGEKLNPSPEGRGIFSKFHVDHTKFQPQNVNMLALGKLVVVMLLLGVVVTSFCAQACSFPQPSAPDCPQHPHSGTTNCCEHSSTDATCATMAVLFLPQPQWITCNLPNPMTLARPYKRAEMIVPHTTLEPPKVLRV